MLAEGLVSISTFTRVCVMAMVLVVGPVSAQSSSDEAWYRSFVHSIGKTLFFCAWPTDTYDHMEFGGIDWKSNGADVTVVLHGNSWLEGKVWTEVVTEIRNGSVTNLRFGRNNGLIKPGTTIKMTGQALAALNDEYQRQQRAQAGAPTPPATAPSPTLASVPVSVVCINNATGGPLTYSMPSERVGWKTLEANQSWIFWHNGAGDFTVAFAGDRTLNVQKTVSVKGEMQAGEPASCDQRMTYDFVQDGQLVGLTPRVWVAGTEHAFIPNLLRAETEGNWSCAPGYKWAEPEDTKSTTCVSNSTGLLGVVLQTDAAVGFPKIVTVSPGGSAERAGVPAGSYILRVNGESMEGLTIDQVVARTRGPMYSSVRIAVAAPGSDQVQYFSLTRQ